MSRHFTIGMAVAAALCFVLAGCGGGGGVSQSVVDQLQTELDATQAELDATQTELDTTQTELDTTQTELDEAEEETETVTETITEADKKREQQIADLAASIAALTTALAEQEAEAATPDDTTTGADDAEDDAEDEVVTTTPTPTPPTPTPQPPTTTTPTTQSAEATQRAERLLAAFGGPADTPAGTPVTALALTDSPVTITVPRPSSMRLVRGGYSTATLSGTGLRSATMALTGTGDSGKTVIYTDRELTRTLLDYYSNAKASAEAVEFRVDGTAGAGTAGLITIGTGGQNVADSVVTTKGIPAYVSVSHGLGGSVSATAKTQNGAIYTGDDAGDATRTLTREAASFSGSVHKVGGTFRCTGATNCMVTATGTYVDNDPDAVTTDENKLNAVILSVPGAAELVFRPSSAAATVSLCDDSVLCTAGTDIQYMKFGYWREDPVSPAGTYRFQAFAEIEGADASGVPTATYDGTAVGSYVEKDPSAAVDTYRQGDFVADVDLTADGTNVFGTIDDFVATPTGGSSAPKTASRWVVTLAPGANSGNVTLNLPGGSADDGQWATAFVDRHGNARADAVFPAVVGVFDARILNSVAIVGAFGATKR